MRFYRRAPHVWYRWFAWRPVWMSEAGCWAWLEWVARRDVPVTFRDDVLGVAHDYRFLLADSYDDEARTTSRWRWSGTRQC